MDRRTLLKSLLGGGLAPMAGAAVAAEGTATPSLAKRPQYPTYAHPLYAEGLRLHWSGWKGSQENQWLVGQWFAWPEPRYGERTPNSAYYYLSVPGMQGGRYNPGDTFNLTVRDPAQGYVFPETPEHEKDRLIWAGYAQLRVLLLAERG